MRSYAAIAGFLVVVSVLVWLHHFIPQGTSSDALWIILLAFVVVLPLIGPLLARRIPTLLDYLARTFKRFNAPLGFGGEFRDPPEALQAPSTHVDRLAEDLVTPLRQSILESGEDQAANTYRQVMTTYGSVIVQRVLEIAAQRSDIVYVDLGAGDKWLLPNLYFFALLLQSGTCVRQLLFTHKVGENEGVFAGMCPPSVLLVHINAQYPLYVTAAQSIREPEPSGWPSKPLKFFQTINEQAPNYPDSSSTPNWVTVSSIRSQLGIELDVAEVIEAQGELTRPDLIRVFLSPTRFIPIISGGQVRYVLDHWKVSAAATRQAATEALK
jgi:hypothetical protein